MSSRLITIALLVTALCWCHSLGHAREESPPVASQSTGAWVSLDQEPPDQRIHRRDLAPANDAQILGLWTFDNGNAEGWTSVDLTAQTGTYWHVDDFAGLGGGDFGYLVPLEGARSMWCGLRASASAPTCQYATPPGYGNDWDQLFRTSECLTVTGDVTLDYLISWHCETGYDFVSLEYDRCDDNWIELAGGWDVWDGVGGGFFTHVVPDSAHSGETRIRFRFYSDGAFSDEDDMWNSDGAVILDSLTVSDTTGVRLSTETFESEPIGATITLSGAWTADVLPGYGDFAALFSGHGVLQEDLCLYNTSYFWGFFSGSTTNYSCAGYPEQATVPYENLRGQFSHNEIWSPLIPLAGTTGTRFELEFDVYRDLHIDYLLFHVWHVRSIDADGCPGEWRDRGFVYFGFEKEWLRIVQPFGDLVEPGAVAIQVALGVRDMCPFWCGPFFIPQCHSHSPLLDNIEVRRIQTEGPQWSVNSINLFQDTFAADGTTTGTARIDAAIDLLHPTSSNIRPGDSTTVTVLDPEAGLAVDSHTGAGPAVYTYVSVQGPSGSTPGTAYSDDATRWPVVDSLTHDGDTWYCVRMDTVYQYARPVANRFCIDVNDSLFVPGDIIRFAFAALSAGPGSKWTYWTPFTGRTEDLTAALCAPAECTILPVPGHSLLYVDGFDGLGAQPYFDSAFEILGIAGDVDRYDIRGPDSREGNRPGGRVVNPLQQLLPHYRIIMWNTGDLRSGLIGDGTNTTDKSDDASMLLSFLEHLQAPGGVYFSGDNIASEMEYITGNGAVLRDTYINHDLKHGDHRVEGLALNPLLIAEPGACFYHVAGPDSLYGYAGCPDINDFDVIQPLGNATTAMRYAGGTPGSNGAVIAQHTTNPELVTVGVTLSGVSYHNLVASGHGNQVSQRIHHLQDILEWLGSPPLVPVNATPTHLNSLAQNVPNPFNPVTAIEFTVKERTPVTLRIYNVRGQLIKTLVDEERARGIAHRIEWDGRNDAGQSVASGVYFYRLVTKGFTSTKKMVLLK